MSKYLKPEDIREPIQGTIRSIERETVDGRPMLVIYFDEFEEGVVMTKNLADDLTKLHGRNRMVDEFFAGEGKVH